MEDRSRVRLTPLGAILLGALALGIVAVFVGSHTVQVAGFVVVVITVLLIVADRIPDRLKWWLTPPMLRNASGLTKPQPRVSQRERDLMELRARRLASGPGGPGSRSRGPGSRSPGGPRRGTPTSDEPAPERRRPPSRGA